MGTPLPSPKGVEPLPKFSAHVYCGHMAVSVKMALGMEVGLSPGDCVRWGSSPLPKKGVEPPLQFLVHFYCGQTALCIKMPLGVEVSLSPLSPGDFVLDGDPAPHQKEGGAPQFLARGYCDQTADGSRWHLVWRWAFGPGHTVLDGDPAPLCKKGAEPPNFRPMFILTKRLDASRCHLVWR